MLMAALAASRMRETGIWFLFVALCSRFAYTVAEWDDTVAFVSVVEPAGALANITYNYHLAHFGAVPYGTNFEGIRVVAIDPSCICGDFPCNTGCGDFAKASEECTLDLKLSTGAEPGSGSMVLAEESADVDAGCLRSERAFNLAKAGAQAVMIVPPHGVNDSSLVVPPAVHSHSETAAYETLLLQHVNIPVGLMTFNHAQALKKVVANTNSGVLRVKVDFSDVFTPPVDTVRITVWHNTGDDCGPPCYYLHQFLAEMADVAKLLVPGHPITLVPRFTYDRCDTDKHPICEVSCTNVGRYCHRKIENTHLWGRVVASENIRQACLYNVLRTAKGNKQDTREFWNYKTWFQENCTNNKRTFNHVCSEEAFNQTLGGSDLFGTWKQCWSNVGDLDVGLPIAQRDIDGMKDQEISEGLLATVVINDQHYRGSLDSAHVLKAACTALKPEVSAGLELCKELTKGTCAPGTAGDKMCGSALYADINRSVCKEADNEAGFTCECTAGYGEITSEDGLTSNGVAGTCIDRNECVEFDTLCKRNSKTRNACKNTEGSFSCVYDVANFCTESQNYSGCWTEKIGRTTITSCEDMFLQYSANLENGREGGALHKCNCENIFGCYAGGSGDCEQQCDPARTCNPQTQECTATLGNAARGALIAGLGGAAGSLVLLGVLLVALLYYRRHKKEEAEEGKGVVTNYVDFKDGLDADEMQQSGAAEGKPSAPVPVGAGQPAVSASQYATQAGADLNVPMHASLHLEEQSSAQLES